MDEKTQKLNIDLDKSIDRNVDTLIFNIFEGRTTVEVKDYGSNSFRSKEKEENRTARNRNSTEPEHKEKVTSGKVSTKKPSLGKKVSDNLFIEDITKVKNYLIYDIALPAAKKLISESVSSAVDMMLYGETRRHDQGSSGGVRRDYTRAYDDRNNRGKVATRSGTYSYDEIIFDTAADANMVLDEMWKDIDNYGMVSIADMYDHAGVMSERYTDNKYGWTNIRNADVGRNTDGSYYLKLPKPQALD